MQTAVTLHGLRNNKMRSSEVVVFSAPYRHNLFLNIFKPQMADYIDEEPREGQQITQPGHKNYLGIQSLI